MIHTLVVALSSAVLAVAPGAAATATGPATVALWHLDEQPGAQTTVDSAAGHDGVPTDVVMGTDGYSGTAYTFADSGMVRVPDSPDLDPGTAPIQLSAYLRVPASLTVGDYNVVQKGTATAVGGAYKLEIFGRSGAKFGFPDCAFNGARGHDRVYGPSSVADGRWHRVVCVLTSTEAYVTVDGTAGPRVRRTVTSIDNSVDVTLGGKPNDSHYFTGDLDEVSIVIG